MDPCLSTVSLERDESALTFKCSLPLGHNCPHTGNSTDMYKDGSVLLTATWW